MAMSSSARPTSALSSLEAMLYSLMRGSGSEGGAGGRDDGDAPIGDTLASSPPPPPLPARPTPRGRHPSRPRHRARVRAAEPWAPPPMPSSPSPSSPSPSPSPIEEPAEDARMATAEDVSGASVVEELERKAVDVEARLREEEDENAALKRRIESYHIRWLEYEIRIKSLEEAFHEQMAALQIAQDAARMAEESAYDRRGPSEPHGETTAGEEPPVVRLWHGRDRLSSVSAGRRSAVSRLGSEFRRQSRTLERAVEPPAAAAAPAASSANDLKRLKAQFSAWTKDFKARLRRAQAEIDRDRRRRGSCWI